MPLELKATINLPKTAFPMKANLPQNEPKMLGRWEQLRIYERIREARKGSPTYILHDGPPYTSGPIHLKSVTRKAVRELEGRIILSALEANRWNRKRAARDLRISYRALLYKIRQAGLPAKRSTTLRAATNRDA